MVEAIEVQQVVTRVKAKTAEWETPEAIWKASTKSVEEANKRNFEEMRQGRDKQLPTLQLVRETGTTEEEPTWQALT